MRDKKNQKKIIEGAACVSQPGARFVQKTGAQHVRQQPALGDRQELRAEGNLPETPLATRQTRRAAHRCRSRGAFSMSRSMASTRTPTVAASPERMNSAAEVSGAITAFYKDLAARGHKDRLRDDFSEFGRRAKENGSKGTDHGSGPCSSSAAGEGRLRRAHRSLTKLEDGNQKHAIDFRQVYASVLDQWLGVERGGARREVQASGCVQGVKAEFAQRSQSTETNKHKLFVGFLCSL